MMDYNILRPGEKAGEKEMIQYLSRAERAWAHTFRARAVATLLIT